MPEPLSRVQPPPELGEGPLADGRRAKGGAVVAVGLWNVFRLAVDGGEVAFVRNLDVIVKEDSSSTLGKGF